MQLTVPELVTWIVVWEEATEPAVFGPVQSTEAIGEAPAAGAPVTATSWGTVSYQPAPFGLWLGVTVKLGYELSISNGTPVCGLEPAA